MLKHPFSISAFRTDRPEQYNFVMNELNKVQKAIISMPVKSGKRIVVECEAAIDSKGNASPNVQHIFATSFNRKDCIEQMQEMALYGIKVFCGKDLYDLPHFVAQLLVKNVIPVIHFDESDFGTGDIQIASKIFNDLLNLDNDGWKKIKIRAYSATNEEAIYSEFADLCANLEINLPTSFRHAPWFLAQNMVEEADEFWSKTNKDFTTQGKEALDYWLADKSNEDSEHFIKRRFAVVRFAASKGEKRTTYKDVRHNKHFCDKLKNMGINPIFIDSNNQFYWGKDTGNVDGWAHKKENTRYLLVVNQTCIRSTEVGFHPLISFWHDFRSKQTPYSTCAQAMFRVNHYDYLINPGYWNNPEVKIKIYGCVDTFRFAAKKINAYEYKDSCRRNLSIRIENKNKVLSRDPADYETIDFTDEHDFMLSISKKWGVKPNSFETENGVYKNRWRGTFEKWDIVKLEAEKFSGLNENNKFRKFVYYDENDVPHFWAIHHSGKMEDTSSGFKAKKSMYKKLIPLD